MKERIEAVTFLFIKNDMVLLEDRGKGFDNEAFFPSGAVDLVDRINREYRINALYREVSEEFNNMIKILAYDYLGKVDAQEINVLFYIYNIVQWEGEFPSVIQEEGSEDSVIKFFPFSEARKLYKYDTCFKIMSLVQNHYGIKT